MVMIESQLHNFFVSKEKTIIPNTCQRAVDTESGDVITSVNRAIGPDPDTVEDVCFAFEIERVIDDCQEQTVYNTVVIESQPALPSDLLQQITQEYADDKFTICVPKGAINDPRMPRNRPVNLIFTV